MPLLAPSADYTSRDFDSLRERLVALVRSVFPEWTEFDVAAFGTVLLECFAFVGDVLGFYVDAQGRESRLLSATQRRNVVALARALGYRVSGATAARAELELSLPLPPAADVLVPAGTVVRETDLRDSVRFQTLAPAIISAGANPAVVRVPAEHSTAHEELFDATHTPRLELVLAHAPYLDGSAVVSAAGGDFSEVPSLVTSTPSDRHFVVVVDDRDRAVLRFGDGVRGVMPTVTLRVAYKTGGGTRGNVESNTLLTLERAFTDVRGTPVQLRVTNPRRAEGGTERESIAQIRERAPLSLRAPSRTVSREDYEIHAREVPGVARALMLTANEDPAIDENAGVLYVVPDGGGAPTPALKNAVRRQVTDVYPHTLTFVLSVQDAVYLEVNVIARVSFGVGADRDATRDQIRARLNMAFAITRLDRTANPAIDFGYYVRRSIRQPVVVDPAASTDGLLPWSDVFDVVRDTPGVRKIQSWDLLLNGLAEDVRLRAEQFPVLGNVSVIDAQTGEIV